MRLFISYRRADSIGHAGRLFDELVARFGRDHVFMDLSGIDAGEHFADKIDTAIQSCDALVAVIGDEWLTSAEGGSRRLDRPDDFVRTEIAAALQRNIPVVPVLVEGARMPSVEELPGPLRPLAMRHAHELSDARWSYDVDRLVMALEKIAGKTAVSGRRRWIAAGATMAVVTVIAVVGFFAMRTPPDPVLPDVSGEWSADVTYSWGATHRERFALKVDGTDIIGTASFLGVPRGIVRGTIERDRISFETRTQEVLEDWNNPKDIVHRYRGTIGDDDIGFVMQSEGGRSDLPIEFTARRSGLPPS
jgi:hypothetical protein